MPKGFASNSERRTNRWSRPWPIPTGHGDDDVICVGDDSKHVGKFKTSYHHATDLQRMRPSDMPRDPSTNQPMGYGKAYFTSATCAQQESKAECTSSDPVKIPGGGGEVAPANICSWHSSKFSGKATCEPKFINKKRNRNTKAMGKDPMSKWWLRFSKEERERMRRSKDSVRFSAQRPIAEVLQRVVSRI